MKKITSLFIGLLLAATSFGQIGQLIPCPVNYNQEYHNAAVIGNAVGGALKAIGCHDSLHGTYGTVTTFSAGTLSPLFTTSVATATTTPALTFSLSTVAAHKFLGGFTGGTVAPTYRAILGTDLRLGLPKIDTLASVDTIYRTKGTDSIKFMIQGRYHAILDSAGGGSGGGLTSGIDTLNIRTTTRNITVVRQGNITYVIIAYTGGAPYTGTITLPSPTNGDIVYIITNSAAFPAMGLTFSPSATTYSILQSSSGSNNAVIYTTLKPGGAGWIQTQ